MTEPSAADRERRRLFRRMEFVFVWAPPLLALVIACSSALFLAAVVPVPGTNFWGRWLLAVLILLVMPTIAYVVRAVVKK